VEQRFQVVIVGGGPVGMALAVELGQRDITCAVVERHREVGRIPKGQGLTHRSLEHFYFWHCVDKIRTARLLPTGYPIGGVTVYGNLMGDYWYPDGAARNLLDPYYFQKNERLPQYLTEEVLRARASELPSVTLLFERTVKTVSQDDDGVRVSIASDVWPYEDEEISADYVVGCDGARSLVCQQLGIERHGTDFEQRMVLAVFASPELHDGLERLGKRTTFHVVDPVARGAWRFFGRVEVGRSFFFHAPVADETTPNDLDYLHALMEEVAGFSFPVEFEHVGFWNLRIEVADTYRRGRVFIAGDAAHSHPPYGGFGLNSGLEDITNLGWKLAATLEGWGGDALLDSYSEERQPIFVQTGEDVIAGGIKREAAWMQRFDPDLDRAAFEQAWGERATASDGPREYEVHYAGSSIVHGPPGATIGVHSTHEFRARDGHHLAPQPLSSGRNVFEELGSGFTLLAFGVDEAEVAAFARAALSIGVPLKIVQDGDDLADAYGARLLLVRPDQFIAWCGVDPPADALAVLRKAVAA
jgi:2-polyprenyl-6-methoxyphenol hydroxylase-like FAD-dependent oxidoreductase